MAGNKTVGSGKRHGDGENDDAGSDKSLLPLNNKCIHAEGILLNLDRPCGGVPVAAEIMGGRALVGRWGSYGGNLGWNPWGELDFTGRTETTAELGLHEGDLFTTPFLPTRMDRKKYLGVRKGA